MFFLANKKGRFKSAMSKPTPEELVKKQVKRGSLITNFKKNTHTKVDEEDKTIEFYQARLALLDSYWKKFYNCHENLLEYEDELQENEYFAQFAFNSVERDYTIAHAFVQNLLNSLQRETSNSSVHNSTALDATAVNVEQARPKRNAIPKLSLPKFSGVQADWESFKDLFSSIVVENPDIPVVEKLQHLLNSLEGDAARCIGGLTATASNYVVAWEKLTRRYDNKKLRLNSHMQVHLHLPSVTRKSANELKNLLDTADRSVKGLKGLNCPIDKYDIWFVYLIVEKLDSDTRES